MLGNGRVRTRSRDGDLPRGVQLFRLPRPRRYQWCRLSSSSRPWWWPACSRGLQGTTPGGAGPLRDRAGGQPPPSRRARACGRLAHPRMDGALVGSATGSARPVVGAPSRTGQLDAGGVSHAGADVNGITPMSSAILSVTTAGTAAVLAFVLGLNLAVVLTRIRGPLRSSPTTVAHPPARRTPVTLGLHAGLDPLAGAHWRNYVAGHRRCASAGRRDLFSLSLSLSLVIAGPCPCGSPSPWWWAGPRGD